MSRAIQYRQFGGPGVLEMAEVAEPAPGAGEVRVVVRAVGLNPVDSKTFGGDARLRVVGFLRRLVDPKRWFGKEGSRFPRGVARDFAGVIDAVGRDGRDVSSASGVGDLAVGDAVLGTLRSAPGLGDKRGALRDHLVVSIDDVIRKPESLSFETASSLGVAAQSASGALRQLGLNGSDVIVISAAAGGVGSLAVQLAVHQGATVIGIAGKHNADYLRSLGAIPVVHGEGVKSRILEAAPEPVTKFLDCYGGEYVKLGFSLGLSGKAIGTLVPSPGAIIRGAQFTGSRHARPGDLQEVAGLVADGAIKVAIARAYPFDVESVRDAYAELNKGHVRGKLVVALS
ncbi:NADP-dependent oxidoreductase [Actinomyces massiliensis]|uniref:NADP-dependent oxidoreductase n=1 Tax=Actinomyces massiliensis TaxID=461393 RepID=UPI00037B78D9|nr:NADP-dependent oxidoreductase [Actinomyces massiliensis]